MDPVLSVKDLSIGYGAEPVVSGISFDVAKGEMVTIIGPNGAGKSVLVKTLLNFIPPHEGSIDWKKGLRIGYVPQKFFVPREVPLSIDEFFALKGNFVESHMHAALQKVGLSGADMRRTVKTLSGGEFQRVLIAWALLDSPGVVIFDEPTESVDIGGQASVYALLSDLKKKEGTTMLVVTHDLEVVHQYADRVICISHGSLVCSEPAERLTPDMIEKVYGHHEVHHHR